MHQGDEALVLACRRGDATAWERLVSRYQRLVYAIPRRAGLSEEAAADVFQTVFAALVDQLDKLREPARVQAWLVTAAKRETWRVRQRESALAGARQDESAAEAAADPEPLPEEVVIQLEEQHAIRQAMQGLDERCRRLLGELFYRPQAIPYSQVAARLGMPEGSIGPIRARCLQRLKRLMKDH
jgi:RNA polymerase sigma factor (sigma-70 family)